MLLRPPLADLHRLQRFHGPRMGCVYDVIIPSRQVGLWFLWCQLRGGSDDERLIDKFWRHRLAGRAWRLPFAFILQPCLAIRPFDISIRLDMPLHVAMRKMVEMHDHDISRRHRPASTQPAANPIGDHHIDLHVHPVSAIAIPSSHKWRRRGARALQRRSRRRARGAGTTHRSIRG